MNLAIETLALRKHFGATRAVDGIDLEVRSGTVYGLLGPNGAGKTTTIRLLTTLLRPDGGGARVLGHDVVTEAAAVRAKVSLTGQFASVDEEMTGVENMVLIARLMGLTWRDARARARELLVEFDLDAAAGRLVRTFSGGMRRRLDIAASLIVPTELMVLDEPTTGLDPRSRNQVWDIVRGVAADGTTVLLTTQYLEEADRLAERLAVIDHGRVIAEGTSRELKNSVGGSTLHLRIAAPERAAQARQLIDELTGEVTQDGGDDAAFVVPGVGVAELPELLSTLATAGIAVAEVSLAPPSLDEVFLALTGHPAEEEPA
jgi:ABC-2 type transport system ATP-binding protein